MYAYVWSYVFALIIIQFSSTNFSFFSLSAHYCSLTQRFTADEFVYFFFLILFITFTVRLH